MSVRTQLQPCKARGARELYSSAFVLGDPRSRAGAVGRRQNPLLFSSLAPSCVVAFSRPVSELALAFVEGSAFSSRGCAFRSKKPAVVKDRGAEAAV